MGSNYSQFSVLGKRTNVENHSSSLRKGPDLAQCPTKVSPSRMGAASLPPRQPLTPKSPGDAHCWATQRPSAHPAKQAELRNTSTALQTALNPSAPRLCLCLTRESLMIEMLHLQPAELFEHRQDQQLIYAEITVQTHCCSCHTAGLC